MLEAFTLYPTFSKQAWSFFISKTFPRELEGPFWPRSGFFHSLYPPTLKSVPTFQNKKKFKMVREAVSRHLLNPPLMLNWNETNFRKVSKTESYSQRPFDRGKSRDQTGCPYIRNRWTFLKAFLKWPCADWSCQRARRPLMAQVKRRRFCAVDLTTKTINIYI